MDMVSTYSAEGGSFMSFDDVVTRIDAANPVPAKRGPYKKTKPQ